MNTTPPTARPSGPAARRKRDTTLLWAIATFAVLVLSSALLLLMLATGGQLPTLEQGPSWTPPAVAAMPAGGAVAVERPDDQPYLPGDVLQNVSGGRVNLRQTPGFQSKPAEDVIAVLQAGEIMTVLAGPEQADGLRWWRVRFNEAEGWIAERSNSGKLLLGPAS